MTTVHILAGILYTAALIAVFAMGLAASSAQGGCQPRGTRRILWEDIHPAQWVLLNDEGDIRWDKGDEWEDGTPRWPAEAVATFEAK